MSYLARRSLLSKALAFVTLLAVSGLVAQEMDECDTDCHIQASHYYNWLDDNTSMDEEELREHAQGYKDNCMQLQC